MDGLLGQRLEEQLAVQVRPQAALQLHSVLCVACSCISSYWINTRMSCRDFYFVCCSAFGFD